MKQRHQHIRNFLHGKADKSQRPKAKILLTKQLEPTYHTYHPYLLVEALCAKTREENFAKANSPMRSQGLRRFDANLVSEKSAHQSDFSLFAPAAITAPVAKNPERALFAFFYIMRHIQFFLRNQMSEAVF